MFCKFVSIKHKGELISRYSSSLFCRTLINKSALHCMIVTNQKLSSQTNNNFVVFFKSYSGFVMKEFSLMGSDISIFVHVSIFSHHFNITKERNNWRHVKINEFICYIPVFCPAQLETPYLNKHFCCGYIQIRRRYNVRIWMQIST